MSESGYFALFNDSLEHGFYPGWQRLASPSDVRTGQTLYEGQPYGKVWDSVLLTLRAPTAAELENIAARELPPIFSYVRMHKTSDQIVGPGNTANVTWQAASHNVGGGADVGNNRFVCPAVKPGYWRVRVKLDLAAVNANSNYQVTLLKNGVLATQDSHNVGSNRDHAARLTHELTLVKGDALTVQMSHLTLETGGTTIVSGAKASVLVLEWMGGTPR